jgi:uncharacterized C2H2 Zn-finger protein
MPTTKKRIGSKHRDTRGQKRCPDCGALIPARWFRRHLAEKHAAQPSAPQVTAPDHLKSAKAKNVAAVRKQTVSNQQKLQCPHCDKAFARPSSLSTHVRYRHPGKSPAVRALPTTTSSQMGASASAPFVAPKVNVEKHLKTALQELTQRQHEIDEQLSHIEALQSEKETITKQIDAVNAALHAFQG